MKSSKGDTKRKKLFKIFSENLQRIKSHEEIKMEPDFEEGYLCPICFDLFDKSHLKKNHDNPLTLEDVPPKSLGGKAILLTCKHCNSSCGHNLDVHLVNRLQENEAIQFLPNTKSKTTFEKNGNKVGGLIEVDKNGVIKLDLREAWSNPKEKKNFMEQVFPPLKLKNTLFHSRNNIGINSKFESDTFTVKFPNKSEERKAEIALLKSAYLFAFAKFGYSFLINSGLYRIREQILNPDKQILPKVFWINFDFPDHTMGLNIITSPKELRCYLVIFKVLTKSNQYKFAIALPGPSDPGIKIYENIENILCKDDNGFANIRLENLPNENYTEEDEFLWASHIYWQKFCS
ncbi:MAG: hypothetical protein AAF388_10450 [Bacteroidota bacterium]